MQMSVLLCQVKHRLQTRAARALTSPCKDAGRAGGWNSEAMLRLARENPRLHAALLKTHPAGGRDVTHNQVVLPPQTKSRSPTKATGTPSSLAGASSVARPVWPAAHSFGAAKAHASSASSQTVAAAERSCVQPASEHTELAWQASTLTGTGDNSTAAATGCSREPSAHQSIVQPMGVEHSRERPFVRFSLHVSRDAMPSRPSRRSATTQVPLPRAHPVLASGSDT